MQSPWRQELIDYLSEYDLENLTIIDPSVDDWENDVGEQDADNPKFVKQTDWEQDGLAMSDVQVFHFDASSIAPVSLLEFGMHLTGNTLLCVKEGYEKGGYMEYMSRRHSLPIERTCKGLASLISIRYHLRPKG